MPIDIIAYGHHHGRRTIDFRRQGVIVRHTVLWLPGDALGILLPDSLAIDTMQIQGQQTIGPGPIFN